MSVLLLRHQTHMEARGAERQAFELRSAKSGLRPLRDHDGGGAGGDDRREVPEDKARCNDGRRTLSV